MDSLPSGVPRDIVLIFPDADRVFSSACLYTVRRQATDKSRPHTDLRMCINCKNIKTVPISAERRLLRIEA